MKPEIEIILEDDKLELLRRFCEYAVMFYIPYFLTANFGADAAVNDLSLYKKLKKFSQVDKLLAEEARHSLPPPPVPEPQHCPVLSGKREAGGR